MLGFGWKDWERDSELVFENISWYEVLTSNSCHLIRFHVPSTYASKSHSLWLISFSQSFFPCVLVKQQIRTYTHFLSSREYDSQGYIPCKKSVYIYIYIHIYLHIWFQSFQKFYTSPKRTFPPTGRLGFEIAGTSQRMPKVGGSESCCGWRGRDHPGKLTAGWTWKNSPINIQRNIIILNQSSNIFVFQSLSFSSDLVISSWTFCTTKTMFFWPWISNGIFTGTNLNWLAGFLNHQQHIFRLKFGVKPWWLKSRVLSWGRNQMKTLRVLSKIAGVWKMEPFKDEAFNYKEHGDIQIPVLCWFTGGYFFFQFLNKVGPNTSYSWTYNPYKRPKING